MGPPSAWIANAPSSGARIPLVEVVDEFLGPDAGRIGQVTVRDEPVVCAPSSAPTSSPRSIRQSPSAGSSTAAAQRSASGSLAMTRSAADGARTSERKVDRSLLLGVREGDGREVRVGHGLLVDDDGGREARLDEGRVHRAVADAVQARVDDAQVAR